MQIPLPPSADGFDDNGDAEEPEEAGEAGEAKHPFPAGNAPETGEESEKAEAGDLGESNGGLAFEAEELSNERGRFHIRIGGFSRGEDGKARVQLEAVG